MLPTSAFAHALSFGLICAIPTSATSAANWPAWRGLDGTGRSDDDAPRRWSATENVRWRTPLPDRGNSTPIVWGSRVFLTQAIEKENRRALICFNRSDGKLLWQSGITYTEDEPTHRSNPYCAASPVTDGERVIAFFGAAGLYCFDLEGKELWRRNLGKITHLGGYGASPILYRNLCILNFGPGENGALIAVNKNSGAPVWRVETPTHGVHFRSTAAGNSEAPRAGGQGRLLAWALFKGADTDQDEQITADEFSSLAKRWFDASDAEKSGKVNEVKLAEGLNHVVGRPPDYSQPGTRSGLPAPGTHLAPFLMQVVDLNQDAVASRDEFMNTFAGWFQAWDSDKSRTVTALEFRPGIMKLISPSTARSPAEGSEGHPGSWCTPLVVGVDGHDELIMALPERLAAFDPLTGKELWSVKGLGTHIKTSPVRGEGLVVAMGGGPVPGALAVKPGGQGAVDDTHRVWQRSRVRNRIGSGVIHEGRFYTVSEVGIAECLDLRTGQTVWEERLQSSGGRSSTWSSIVLVRDRLYVPTHSGNVFVLRAGPKFEILNVNSVGDETMNASLAVSDGEIFLRTFRHLWCIADKPR
ncbi:MAG: PQQ-binding-like beta-propeller repeat protein [Verrucomicrobia bacterium]|nr:PQQ-binding-like beta-propeller repeat protein [Verrucomicrobiota bacterium]